MKNESDLPGTDHRQPQDRSQDEGYPPTILGWIARVVSLGLIATLVGLVGWKMSQAERPIHFTAEIAADEIRWHDDEYLIPIDIENEGSRTAKSVSLELELGGEITSIEIDLIGASEIARFVVPRPNSASEVELQLISYEAP